MLSFFCFSTVGASEYLVSPPTVYSELESDTEVFAANEIQVEEGPLHCLYEAGKELNLYLKDKDNSTMNIT